MSFRPAALNAEALEQLTAAFSQELRGQALLGEGDPKTLLLHALGHTETAGIPPFSPAPLECE